MPTLHNRVTSLEARADAMDERVDDLEAWVGDEAKLREINSKQIELLKQADAIHERRLRELGPRVKRSK